MKRLVLLCLTLMIFCFISGGIYIVFSIFHVTDSLERVNSFHRVEFLRENLVHHIKNVQSDLLLQRTEYALSTETVIKNVEAMEAATEVCLSCHHSEETKQRLNDLLDEVDSYMHLISRAMTMRANQVRLENVKARAYSQGESLLQYVTSLSIASAEKIGLRINQVRDEINATNNFLIVCLILGPIAIILITLFFLRRFTGSVSTLVVAADELKSGNLDYRIEESMKDEFGTLAHSFNSMVTALQDERYRFRSVYRLYKTLFDSAGDAIMIKSAEPASLGKIISANPAACELYGYPCEELIGKNISCLIPDDSDKDFSDEIRMVMKGNWEHQTVKRKKLDGTVIPVDISIGLLEIDDKKHLLSFAKDISDRLQAEEDLQRANQMALVGKMSAGLAHEIKNPLAGIKVSLELLASELAQDSDDQELIARMINEITRMERLLKSLLNYARPPQPHFDLVDINRLLENTIKNAGLSTSSLAQEIVFENDFCSDLHLVEADSSQLQQVFLNILINATEAMPNGGTISTITRMDGDDHVWIEISDTGKGIVPAKADKIFDPFFTTKTRGTGLGLAICRRLVEQHGGTIEVQSTLGEGTSIVICLPLAQQNKEGGA